MGKPVVYTLGRVIVDLYASEVGVPLLDVQSFQKYLGGSAGNTAVGLARLGASVGLISKVGRDDFGTFLTHRLEREHVDTRMLGVDATYPTGLAFAALFPPNDSDVLFYRKPCADIQLGIHDLSNDDIRDAKILVVACTALSVSPCREAALAALEMNRATGGINVLDIDWREMFWSSREEAQLYYGMALRLADVVLANEPELVFVGKSGNPDDAAQAILAFGVEEVVAKRGGDGCLHYRLGQKLYAPPVKVEVLNTLGAGDGFGAAYTYGLLQGWPVEQRLAFATTAGAIVVNHHSCSEAMPTLDEVETLMKSQPQ
jgi:5-dehydro-2-deoxygluconokinase